MTCGGGNLSGSPDGLFSWKNERFYCEKARNFDEVKVCCVPVCATGQTVQITTHRIRFKANTYERARPIHAKRQAAQLTC